MAKVYTRESLSGDQYALLERVNWSEDGIVWAEEVQGIEEMRLANMLARKGLLTKCQEFYEITLAGRYVVEPEATTELYGPQDA